MAKRLSEKQKNQIINEFYSGKTIDNLANKFNFTKLTISRNLKKNLGEKIYNEIISKNRSKSKTSHKKISVLFQNLKLNKFKTIKIIFHLKKIL